MRRLWGKVPRGLILLGLLAIGVLLLALPNYLQWEWDHGVSTGLGEALVVFAFLAFTVERWFRQEFAEDVFYAGLGATLRPEFRDELKWITSFKWLSTKCACRFKLDDLGDGIVRVTMSISRETENISPTPEKRGAKLGIDEFGMRGYRSSVEACLLQPPDGSTINGKEVERELHHLEWATKDVVVQPGETIKTFTKSIEYKTTNDMYVLNLGTPVKDPEVEVEASPSLVAHAGFSHRGKFDTEPLHGKRILNGTLLPSQVIIIRWWPTSLTA